MDATVRNTINPPAVVREVEDGERQLIDQWEAVESDAKWEQGQLASEWTEKYARGRTDEDFAKLVGSARRTIHFRRSVYDKFGPLRTKFNLSWTHYKAALTWHDENPKDAADTLRWASDNRATIKDMQEYHANKHRDFLTIDEWNACEDTEALFVGSDKTFNKQDNSSIEWAQWSWNPITGCKHDCPYCYARDIAQRFYKQGFEPSIYPSRFAMPYNTKVPEKAESDTAYRNVFTGSMADIFGRWVPEEWIDLVLREVRENKQWNFLFLTKFPQRVHEFGDMPENAWMGTTVDCQDRVKNAETAFAKMGGGIKWLSIEPMLTPLTFSNLGVFDWVVIGGASASTKTPAWVPPLDWVVDLHKQARDAGCAVYYKDNVKMGDELRIKEYPWEQVAARELPDALKYLNIK